MRSGTPQRINLNQFEEIGKQGKQYGTEKEQSGHGNNSTGSEEVRGKSHSSPGTNTLVGIESGLQPSRDL
jgi:hypothetical protein